MRVYRAWWQKGQEWIRGAANNVAYKCKTIYSKARQRKQNRPWWKRELHELVSDLSQLRFRNEVDVAIKSVLDISQWTLRFRLVVLGIIFSGAFLLSAVILCADASNGLRLQSNERQMLEARYLNYASQVDLLPVYQKQTEFILGRFGDLLDAIPGSLESVHVLSLLNKAAKDSGLHLEFFKPLAEEVDVYYAVLPIEIRLRGDYKAIARFLELVSKMQHLVTVDVVMLPSATHESQVVLASLLKAYRYKNLPEKSEKKAAYATP